MVEENHRRTPDAGRRTPDAGRRTPDAGLWETVRPVRRVLVIVRTPATLDRLWDLVRLLTTDPRLEVSLALDEGSRFSAGLHTRLATAGALQLTWADAITQKFDVALAASDNTDLHLVQAPVILMPHGAGFQRYAAGTDGEISGLRRSALVHEGEIVPHTVVVAHPDEITALNDVDQRLPGRALVAGDPALQRIRRNLPLNHRYRQAFGTLGRRMVLLSSTWGPESLFGRNPSLANEIVRALPIDEFTVALVLHPNVWERHGALQVRAWTRSATTAGLRLLPAESEWRAAIVAADLVISDHGSLTVYAAAAGKPVLLAADGGDEVVKESTMDRLRASLPHLDPVRPLEDQILAVLAKPAEAGEPATSTFADQDAITTMLARLYEIMALACPRDLEADDALPVPEIPARDPTVIHTAFLGASVSGDRATLRLRRATAPLAGSHLVVSDQTNDINALENAAALFGADLHPSITQARTRTHDLLRTYPLARLAVTETRNGHRVAAFRDGRHVTIAGAVPTSAACSALYWWSASADRPHRITVESGTASGGLAIQT